MLILTFPAILTAAPVQSSWLYLLIAYTSGRVQGNGENNNRKEMPAIPTGPGDEAASAYSNLPYLISIRNPPLLYESVPICGPCFRSARADERWTLFTVLVANERG